MQLVPPEVKDTPEAPKQAREALRKMGPMSRDQLIMSATMAGMYTMIYNDCAPTSFAKFGLNSCSSCHVTGQVAEVKKSVSKCGTFSWTEHHPFGEGCTRIEAGPTKLADDRSLSVQAQ